MKEWTPNDLINLSLTDILLVLCLVLVVIYYIHWSHSRGVWQRVGVPGPKPWPIIDHRLEIGQDIYVTIEKWFKQYGDTFGVYGLFPHMPTLVTKDLYLVKQVLVKDFSNFMDRSRPIRTWSSIKHALASSGGAKWRRHRYVIAPMFTGIKLKLMVPHVRASAQTLAELVTQTAAKGELITVKPFVTKFTTDIIARVAFGVQANTVSMEDTEFSYYCKNLYDRKPRPFQKLISKACDLIQPLDQILEFFNVKVNDFVNRSSDEYFAQVLKTTIEERKKERNNNGKVPSPARDLIDLLMDGIVEDDDVRLTEVTSKKLSLKETIGNLTGLLLGGIETVSTASQYLIYSLARYTDIQAKVIEEIDMVIPEDQQVEYEHLAELKYTEKVINESLRMYALVATILRWPQETRTYNGITIPAGTMVHISTAHIMMDPDIWPNPETFEPERFSTENKATRDFIAFLPFGHGPRFCLGQRLAMMELKMAMVYLLRRVKFSLSDRSMPKKGETPTQSSFGLLSRGLDTPIIVEAVLRK